MNEFVDLRHNISIKYQPFDGCVSKMRLISLKTPHINSFIEIKNY